MGYTTDFEGDFKLDKPLKPEHAQYLKDFSATRRMKRSAVVAALLSDPVRKAAGLPIGDQGCCFVGNTDNSGQEHDKSVTNYNTPPDGQPSLWCQWVPNDEGTAIEWDYSEKFYNYIEWIKYLMYHFLKPWGYTLNGMVKWYGEDGGDMGMIIIKDNEISIKNAEISYK